MNKVKCVQCGLVNWDSAADCLRCKTSLSAAAPAAVQHDEQPAGAAGGGFGILKLGLTVVVLSCVGLGAYNMLLPESSATSAVPAANTSVIMDQQKVQKMLEESRQKDLQRMADLRAAPPPMTNFKMTPDQIKQNQKQYFERGTHFGPGAMPPGTFERNNPKPSR